MYTKHPVLGKLRISHPLNLNFNEQNPEIKQFKEHTKQCDSKNIKINFKITFLFHLIP